MQSLIESFRNAISEDGETGMLIAADAMEESDDTGNQLLGQLLRRYVEIQTIVRMSSKPSAELKADFEVLNKLCGADKETITEGKVTYRDPLGPYWTGMTVRQSVLAENMSLLSTQPIRQLYLVDVRIDNDLGMILRNYRFGNMVEAYLSCLIGRFSYQDLQTYVKEMEGTRLRKLTITVPDQHSIIATGFALNRTIQTGCKLFMPTASARGPAQVAERK